MDGRNRNTIPNYHPDRCLPFVDSNVPLHQEKRQSTNYIDRPDKREQDHPYIRKSVRGTTQRGRRIKIQISIIAMRSIRIIPPSDRNAKGKPSTQDTN